jgi:hypothetical protein
VKEEKGGGGLQREQDPSAGAPGEEKPSALNSKGKEKRWRNQKRTFRKPNPKPLLTP